MAFNPILNSMPARFAHRSTRLKADTSASFSYEEQVMDLFQGS
jgi:hypothetical protein